MRSSASVAADPRRWLRAALLLLCLAVADVARAEGIAVTSASLRAGEEAYELDASFEIQFSGTLLEALARGLPLYFITDIELTRGRWYWLDEVVARQEIQYRLSYNALTRQYRLATGALYQNFDTLEEAAGVLSNIRGRPVADKAALKRGEEYTAGVRLRLDTSQLPTPFQVSALTSRDWSLSSGWLRWKVAP
ncbi:MAG TPA: DUF4390 domain-containing protein [Burkholderiales bacterium]|nr:DUF4390 domain-containing protein [Burkholderiales bacterium]